MRAGGGASHRGNLSDWVMFKDNHLAAIGIDEAVRRARHAWPARTIHVEVDDIDGHASRRWTPAPTPSCSTTSRPTRPPRPCVAADAVGYGDDGGRRPWLECSGGITVETAAAYSATGVDLLSTSQITQSAPAPRHRPATSSDSGPIGALS